MDGEKGRYDRIEGGERERDWILWPRAKGRSVCRFLALLAEAVMIDSPEMESGDQDRLWD